MSDDLQNEVEAINSIYGEGSLCPSGESGIYVLNLPSRSTSLKIQFPLEYPTQPPTVLGIQAAGDHARKGEGSAIVDIFCDVLRTVFHSGEVCLFDAIEEFNTILDARPDSEDEAQAIADNAVMVEEPRDKLPTHIEPLPWVLSDVVIELKSVFVARTIVVSSPAQAKEYVQNLLDSDRKIRSATHNITAWRIKAEDGVSFQDCDDDGESAAGGRLLHLLQLMDVWNVMVVVTRWYGGHQLGPKRFSIINTVARDAIVKAGFVVDSKAIRKKGKH